MSDIDPNSEAVHVPLDEPPSNEIAPEASNSGLRLAVWVLSSIIGVIALTVVGAGVYYYFNQSSKSTSSTPNNQTETVFIQRVDVSGQADDVLHEWREAREDHKRIAFAIAACDQYSNIDTMPRGVFSILLLDLNPSGQHQFPKPRSTSSDSKSPDKQPANSGEESVEAGGDIELVGLQPAMITLSDEIARARVDAARTAHDALPGVNTIGYLAIIFTALTTLLVSLKPLFESWKTWTLVLTIATLIVSVSSTALTSVKTIYDPSQAYSANEQALVKLRNLHRLVAIELASVYVPNGCGQETPAHTGGAPAEPTAGTRHDPMPQGKLENWAGELQNIEAAITPATVVVPNSPVPQNPAPGNTPPPNAPNVRPKGQ
jgi:hypothetical protein